MGSCPGPSTRPKWLREELAPICELRWGVGHCMSLRPVADCGGRWRRGHASRVGDRAAVSGRLPAQRGDSDRWWRLDGASGLVHERVSDRFGFAAARPGHL